MSQSLARIPVHVVFSTLKRQPRLAEELRPGLYRKLAATAKAFDCPLLEAGGTPDHVHLLLEISRTETLARVVGVLKSRSSAWISRRYPHPESFRWQGGYTAFALSAVHIEPVREYIRAQESYHLRRTYQQEVRAWLTRYGLAWDEHHLWE